jgi:hypothetical protein
MSMARNDIEVVPRDGIAAARDDRPDFAYRVRLVTSHLVESDDQLRDVLAGMSDRPSEMHLDHRGEHPLVTLACTARVWASAVDAA